MNNCKGYGGKYCYNETDRTSGYCFDCENRKREDMAYHVHNFMPQLSSENYAKPVYMCECGATCNHSASLKQTDSTYKCADCGAIIE